MKPTPVQRARPSQSTRIKTRSTPRYRANPAQTPATFLLRLSSIKGGLAAGGGAAAVRQPQPEQKRSLSRNSKPHLVQYIGSLLHQLRNGGGKCSARFKARR